MSSELHALLLHVKDAYVAWQQCPLLTPRWFSPFEGICDNVGNAEDFYGPEDDLNEMRGQQLENAIARWPDLGDNPRRYPVAGKLEYCRGSETLGLWDNPRRVALLDWLIEETKQ